MKQSCFFKMFLLCLLLSFFVISNGSDNVISINQVGSGMPINTRYEEIISFRSIRLKKYY